MAKLIKVPGIPSPAVDWVLLPAGPATIPLDGLVSYLSVTGHTTNAQNRVGGLSRWVGSDELVAPFAAVGPSIEAVSGVDWLRTTVANQERLIAAPAPSGSPWNYGGASGLTCLFPVAMQNLVTTSQGLLTVGNFRIRMQPTTLQVQKPYSGGTQSHATTLSWAAPLVLGITYDVASQTLKTWKDGALLSTVSSPNWGEIVPSAVVVYGSTFNSGNPSEARLGDFVRYDRALTAAEMAAVTGFLGARFGI